MSRMRATVVNADYPLGTGDLELNVQVPGVRGGRYITVPASGEYAVGQMVTVEYDGESEEAKIVD
jgi:hypothetical protein